MPSLALSYPYSSEIKDKSKGETKAMLNDPNLVVMMFS